MKNALVIGSSCVDVVIKIHHLPSTGEDIHPESQSFMAGGCAYNVANILKRAKTDVTFITPVGGKGIFGSFMKSKLDKLGFSDYIYLPNDENGCCYCFVESDGERTFMSCHGVEYSFNPMWMEPFNNKSFDYGYFCGLEAEEKTGELLVDYLETKPCKTLFYAPGPRGIFVNENLKERIYALSPVLHINESEAIALGKQENLRKSVEYLSQKTNNTVIVTLGEKGVLWYKKGEFHTLPCVFAKVVDTIGAGDSHIGAIMAGLMRDLSLEEALKLANKTASAVVSTKGSTLSDDAIKRIFFEKSNRLGRTQNLNFRPRP